MVAVQDTTVIQAVFHEEVPKLSIMSGHCQLLASSLVLRRWHRKIP